RIIGSVEKVLGTYFAT
ncbi:hypothetical protein ACNVD4_13175, partial [Rhizobium sp. BR5]